MSNLSANSDFYDPINQTNEYLNQVQKFAYIFKTPEIGSKVDSQQATWGGTPTMHPPRANSFDKGNNQAPNQLMNNDECDTNSAASSGNFSAFSENDKQKFYTPNQYHNDMMHVGFTPNMQFSNSNQRMQSHFNYAPGQYYPQDPNGFFYQDEQTPTNHEIQLNEQDVSLQQQYLPHI